MKSKISIAVVIFSFMLLCFASCGGAKKKSNDTHTHEDGSVHQEHPAEGTAIQAEQETFKVEADSTTSTENPAHDHGDGKLHDHGDGKPHKH